MNILSSLRVHISTWIRPRLPLILIRENLPKKVLELKKIFETKGPLIIEFGVGKGQFIKNYALQHPDYQFLGVEKVRKWVRHTAERIEKNKIQNVRLVQSTAEEVIQKIPNQSVQEYYILFPDPWPKRRHQQRRVIQNSLIQKIYETLQTSGKLYIATDHKDYFDWIQNVLRSHIGHQFIIIDEKPAFISNYQTKYEKEGRTIYSIHLQKLTI